MSTTSTGPVSPVIRPMMLSGRFHRSEPSAGVSHPPSHLSVDAPDRAGGVSGNAGGVGEASAGVEPSGRGLGIVELPPPVQPASAPAATAATTTRPRNLGDPV